MSDEKDKVANNKISELEARVNSLERQLKRHGRVGRDGLTLAGANLDVNTTRGGGGECGAAEAEGTWIGEGDRHRLGASRRIRRCADL